jgi:hypothetical protein
MVALAFAISFTIAVSIMALAAVDAKLSSSQARPGDPVVLTTINGGPSDNGPQPVYLVSVADFEKEIAKYGGQRCGAPEQRYLGRLTWLGEVGSLSFIVPSVPNGDYYFELTVPTSSPSCWRIGSSSGPLLLTVKDSTAVASAFPASSAQPVRQSGRLLAVVLVIGGLAILAGVAVILNRRFARRK